MLGCLKEPTKPPAARPATGTSGFAAVGSGFGKVSGWASAGIGRGFSGQGLSLRCGHSQQS